MVIIRIGSITGGEKTRDELNPQLEGYTRAYTGVGLETPEEELDDLNYVAFTQSQTTKKIVVFKHNKLWHVTPVLEDRTDKVKLGQGSDQTLTFDPDEQK
jgi:hypothetical protein